VITARHESCVLLVAWRDPLQVWREKQQRHSLPVALAANGTRAGRVSTV
jgi:hypothetical protein